MGTVWGIPLENFPDRGSPFHRLQKETPGLDEMMNCTL